MDNNNISIDINYHYKFDQGKNHFVYISFSEKGVTGNMEKHLNSELNNQEELIKSHKKYFSKSLGITEEMIIPVSYKEYKENTDEE